MPARLIDRYDHVPVTKENRMYQYQTKVSMQCKITDEVVPWAELVTLDLSQYDQPGGKEELVKLPLQFCLTLGQSLYGADH